MVLFDLISRCTRPNWCPSLMDSLPTRIQGLYEHLYTWEELLSNWSPRISPALLTPVFRDGNATGRHIPTEYMFGRLVFHFKSLTQSATLVFCGDGDANNIVVSDYFSHFLSAQGQTLGGEFFWGLDSQLFKACAYFGARNSIEDVASRLWPQEQCLCSCYLWSRAVTVVLTIVLQNCNHAFLWVLWLSCVYEQNYLWWFVHWSCWKKSLGSLHNLLCIENMQVKYKIS